MKTKSLAGAVALLLVACGGKLFAQVQATPPAVPALMALWQKGDKSGAVVQFLETNWNRRPLLSPALTMSEEKFQKLPPDGRRAALPFIESELGDFNSLACAVRQAGLDAEKKNDFAQARRCFTALQGTGRALREPECLDITRIVGVAVERMGDSGLEKLPQ